MMHTVLRELVVAHCEMVAATEGVAGEEFIPPLHPLVQVAREDTVATAVGVLMLGIKAPLRMDSAVEALALSLESLLNLHQYQVEAVALVF